MHTLSFLITVALALTAAASTGAPRWNGEDLNFRSDAPAQDSIVRSVTQNDFGKARRHHRHRKGGKKAGSVGNVGNAGNGGNVGNAGVAAGTGTTPGAGAGAASGGKKGGKGGNKGNAGSAGNAGNAGGATAGAGGAATAGNNAGGGTATGAGATGGAAANPQALQSSTTIHPSVIQTTDDGQNPPVAGQTAADLSKNNFANACALTPKVPITNGLQITSGSCNPIPIGQIPSVANMPSSKYQSPKNLDTIASDVTFNIVLKTKNIQLGTFTNAQKTYFANPQKLNAQGQIIGHTHVVMETIDSLTTTKLSDPTKFFFFKGVNDAQDAQGNVNVPVAGGVKPGVYRMCTIVSSATHQPAIVPIAQHGSLDDCIYFTATPGGATAPAAATAATAKTAKGAQPAKNSKGATTSKAKSGKGKGGK